VASLRLRGAGATGAEYGHGTGSRRRVARRCPGLDVVPQSGQLRHVHRGWAQCGRVFALQKMQVSMLSRRCRRPRAYTSGGAVQSGSGRRRYRRTMAERTVPILPSRDLRETLAFYGRLGFENRGAPPEEWDYLILGRGELWLHFYAEPDVDPLATAASCFAYVDDAQTLYDEWATRGIAHDEATGSRLVAPVDTDYGMREFAVVDRSGNLLRVGSPVTA
jgi:catechol 2,3-dioxygenase-like lactoylglutathione lyase family enzyme